MTPWQPPQTMKAWERAAEWQERYCPGERLIEAVAACIPGGLVVSSDTLFVLGYEATWDETTGTLLAGGEPNAWVCKLAAATDGRHPIADIMNWAPHPRPWLVWQRRNDGRWRAHRWEKLQQRFKHN